MRCPKCGSVLGDRVCAACRFDIRNDKVYYFGAEKDNYIQSIEKYISSLEESVQRVPISEEQGYAAAQNNLGDQYYWGRGVEQDYEEAVKWYQKAAEQGYARAQTNLGYMYQKGYGVKQDYAEAVKWYQKAAEQGDASGQFNLGVMYDHGYGVKKDYAEAVKWYQKAAEQGDASGQCSLGYMYEIGYSVKQDYEEAVKWYRKAAEQGFATAQFRLGYMYRYGFGVKKDYAEEEKWCRKAAEQGFATTQLRLGNMYRGVEQDYEEAVKWYRKAAEKGDTTAQNNLRTLYLELARKYDEYKNYNEANKYYRDYISLGGDTSEYLNRYNSIKNPLKRMVKALGLETVFFEVFLWSRPVIIFLAMLSPLLWMKNSIILPPWVIILGLSFIVITNFIIGYKGDPLDFFTTEAMRSELENFKFLISRLEPFKFIVRIVSISYLGFFRFIIWIIMCIMFIIIWLFIPLVFFVSQDFLFFWKYFFVKTEPIIVGSIVGSVFIFLHFLRILLICIAEGRKSGCVEIIRAKAYRVLFSILVLGSVLIIGLLIKFDLFKEDAYSQNYLGYMYENGYGVKQDYAEAVKWYQKAADQGYEPAKSRLEKLYQERGAQKKDN